MHRPGGCRPLLSRELSGLVRMFEQTHLFFPHAVVHVCQRLHLYGDKKGRRIILEVFGQEAEAFDAPVCRCFCDCHLNQDADRKACVC